MLSFIYIILIIGIIFGVIFYLVSDSKNTNDLRFGDFSQDSAKVNPQGRFGGKRRKNRKNLKKRYN